MIEFIKRNKTILAQIIRSNYKFKKGINFFTKPNLNQQVAFMNHKKGHKIIPHYHKKIIRKINKMSEGQFDSIHNFRQWENQRNANKVPNPQKILGN